MTHFRPGHMSEIDIPQFIQDVWTVMTEFDQVDSSVLLKERREACERLRLIIQTIDPAIGNASAFVLTAGQLAQVTSLFWPRDLRHEPAEQPVAVIRYRHDGPKGSGYYAQRDGKGAPKLLDGIV